MANLVLWSESGYFDTSADIKPLLHLWSLGIEEQFYMVWPLLLGLAWARKWSVWLVLGLCITLSFALNVHGVGTDPTGTFFSPLTRFWELLAGAALAWAVRPQPGQRTSRGVAAPIHQLLALVGVALLGSTLWLLDEHRAFPGWWAILPTLGTVMLIGAGPQTLVNRLLLSNRLAVWFGVISYPLYLWHWPLLTYARIINNGQPDRNQRIGLVAAAIVLAWLTYQCVEKPLRFGAHTRTRLTLIVSSLGAVFLVGLLVAVGVIKPRIDHPAIEPYVLAAADWQYPGDLRPYLDAQGQKVPNLYTIPGQQEGVTLFWGDSHIMQYAPRLIDLIESPQSRARTAVLAAVGACPPIPQVGDDIGPHPACHTEAERILAFIEAHPEIKTVVLGACWNCYFIQQTVHPKPTPADWDYYVLHEGRREPFRGGQGPALALAQLEGVLKRLARGRNVVLVLDNPFGDAINPRSFLTGDRFSTFEIRPMTATTPLPHEQAQVRQTLKALATRAGVQVIDPMDTLCSGDVCRRTLADGTPIYRDDNHLRSFYVREHVRYLDETVLAP